MSYYVALLVSVIFVTLATGFRVVDPPSFGAMMLGLLVMLPIIAFGSANR